MLLIIALDVGGSLELALASTWNDPRYFSVLGHRASVHPLLMHVHLLSRKLFL
jgi:hypothetical protein